MLKISRVEFLIMVFESLNIVEYHTLKKNLTIFYYIYVCIAHVLDAQHFVHKKYKPMFFTQFLLLKHGMKSL